MATARAIELKRIATRIAGALPPVVEEVVLTGSVSRGVADDLSDIEMLVVTSQPLDLAQCFTLAQRAGLNRHDSWGPQGTEVSRVFGYFGQIPIEADLVAARLRGTSSFRAACGRDLVIRRCSRQRRCPSDGRAA